MEATPAQARFLRFFLQGEPDRAYWLREGRRLGPVSEPFAYEAEATHVMVYRLATGEGLTLPGEAMSRTRISLSDLLTLHRFWDEPLRTLSEAGRAAAKSRGLKRSCVTAFRQTEADRARLEALAIGEGRTPGALVAELVANFLTQQPGHGGEQWRT